MLNNEHFRLFLEEALRLVPVFPHPPRDQFSFLSGALESESSGQPLAANSQARGVKIALFAAPVLELSWLSNYGLNTRLELVLGHGLRENASTLNALDSRERTNIVNGDSRDF